jgi:hypothetical protein
LARITEFNEGTEEVSMAYKSILTILTETDNAARQILDAAISRGFERRGGASGRPVFGYRPHADGLLFRWRHGADA